MVLPQNILNSTTSSSSFDVATTKPAYRICAMPQREIKGSNFTPDSYPEININCEIFNSSATTSTRPIDSWRNLLLPVEEGVAKRIIRTFFESGFIDALNEARDPKTAESWPVVASVAECAFKTLDFLEKLKARIFPHRRIQGVASIANYSENRDWRNSYIRFIAWHPNSFKIAVAGSDDIVRIYTDEPAVVPVLKTYYQKWITAMAWRPYASADLAVGCQAGICLWTVDNNMHLSLGSSQAVLLKHPQHSPVTSLQWNSDGTLLATASIGDTDVCIWCVDKMQHAILQRVGPPCSLLKWSPDGSRLFSATVGSVFRVWNVDRQWLPERWTLCGGYIQSACWSPCGTFLLFVTSQDSILYRLQFVEEQLFATDSAPKLALPVADLAKCAAGHREIGGQPQAIAWDPHGNCLAVTFKDTPCIALFSTSIRKYDLTIAPACYLSGIGTEYPSCICFQSKHRKNTEPVLTIGWSSGRIQYLNFYNN